MDSSRPIVLDSGTGYLKIGWAGDSFPSFTFPAIVGRPMLRYDQKIEGIELKSLMVGDEAEPLRSMLELSYPVEEGIVKNWDDMELVWGRGFKKMGIAPKESRILMTEAAMNPQKNREKMCELLFEKFEFDRVQIGVQALLSLFAEGLMSAMLFDSGDGVTHCIPISEGFILKNQIGRMNLAGRNVTNYLIKLLFLRGYAFNSTADFEVVREIKEKYCFVSSDIALDRKLCKTTTALLEEYRLPDNTLIKIERERFEAPEIIFNPGNAGYSFNGAAEMVFDSINQSPIDIRKVLYKTIVLSGGTTMFPGFSTRLHNDITKLYDKVIRKGEEKNELSAKIEIVDPPRRKYNVFIGAGVFANLMDKEKGWWIDQSQWKECGVKILKQIGNDMTL